jgi:hypothetical protein
MRLAHMPAAAVVISIILLSGPIGSTGPTDRDWPVVSAATRPWTRWWWHGSAVDRRTLTSELEAFRTAGVGGVEITPIYGVRGAEDRFIPYLSADWVQMLEHTVQEAGRLGLGVDMATGTGWPFGGPWVSDAIAPRTIVHRTWTLVAGDGITEPIRVRQVPMVRAIGNQIYEVTERKAGEPPPRGSSQQPLTRTGTRPLRIEDLADPVTANKNLQELALEQVKYPRDLPLIAVVAYSNTGEVVDLTARLDRDRKLAWTAPSGTWVVYALFAGWHGKLVERAAPGGEGNVIDHFSRDAIRGYLAHFDRAFSKPTSPALRAFFNDSYEVDDASGQADWTLKLVDEFRGRRGYDLLHHLPALLSSDPGAIDPRVVADYRETISDLLLDTFTMEWGAWARRRGALVRNQAHGSPANLLDLYAASDIPETEGTEIARFKWATSAAHVAGRQLVSAEVATWLGEHFKTTLADVRLAIDQCFVSGVNHIVYHGTAYSPGDDPWPGWQFYASVDFSQRNAWWQDFAALNQYVTRVQSFLQHGRPDHDVLIYFPFYDAVADRGTSLLTHFGGANRATAAEGFEAARAALQSRGFTYDYISDRQLTATRVVDGRLITGGGSAYRVLVIPSARYFPLETLEHVLTLAHAGATIVLSKGWPLDVAGLHDLDARRRRFRDLTSAVSFGPTPSGVRVASHGAGRLLMAEDVDAMLLEAGIARERMVDQGLLFARRVDEGGRFYFISNRSDRSIDGWVPLETRSPAATIFEPMAGRRGAARTRRSEAGALDVYLQLAPGQSVIVATTASPFSEDFPHYRAGGAAIAIPGPWTVRFTGGGPTLPASRIIDRLESWTTFGGDDVRSFSGTATYTASFARPSAGMDAWELDLGTVHESARVRLNGHDAGTLVGPPYRLVLTANLLAPDNVLDVTVTNLSANRIADLDRRGAAWKKFYNVNFPPRLPANRGADGLFTAVAWEPVESGLIGPVQLTPLAVIR